MKRYLILPLNNAAPQVRLQITTGYALDVKLDKENPQYFAYVPLINFSENELIAREFEQSDILPEGIYSEPNRPQVHFSPKLGWTNDPNGLIYYKGVYHLFFQHNPAGNQWGNMHWGHAVSTDLLHWEEQDIVLYPDKLGTMFSGSAVVDERNVSGLKEGDEDVVMLFYTAAGEPFTQCMAYSADGCRTFRKYEKNPVVSHIVGANRDPKVIWCDELECYTMALYLDGCTYAILKSDNLLDWTELQRFEMPGDSECPDFYPLNIFGMEEYRRWIFTGASDYYYIGNIEGGIFMPEQDIGRLHTGENVLYAAQTYSNLPGGRRVRISWNTTDMLRFGSSRFNMQMSIPADMSLRIIGGKVKLCIYPIPEISALYTDDAEETAAYDMEVHFTVKDAENASLVIFGQTEHIPEKAVKARIIADRMGYEIYWNYGEIYSARGFVCDYGREPVAAAGAELDRTVVRGLKSIWK